MQEWLTFIVVGVCVVIALFAIFRRRTCSCGCGSEESCKEGADCDCPLKSECGVCSKTKSK